MELILATPIEKLIPAMIEWNNSELLNEVSSSLAKYKGLVYSDDQISQAKADRAKLNNFAKALNDERIKIKKIYTMPYEQFKCQVDEVLALIDSASAEINTAILDYENRRQQLKKDDIKAYFNDHVCELANYVTLEKIYNPKWLNASTSFKNVCADIDAIFDEIKESINTIELLQSADEAAIKALYFRNLDLKQALSENARLTAEKKRIEELQLNATKAAAQTPAVEVAPSSIAEFVNVKFEVTATREQLQVLRRCIIDNNIKYSQIK